MDKAKIIYDQTCVVCNYFMRLVKNKVGVERAEYLPASGTASDFEYVGFDGKRSTGTDAIEKLAADFPAIKEYMYALPSKYKVLGLKVAYKAGSVVRKIRGAATKGCNCGGKKK